MKVVHLPCYHENPYQGLLMAAQRELGWEVIDGGGGGSFIGVALRQWKSEVMHFHWLHPYLLRESVVGSVARAARFLLEVFLLKLRGTRIAWTIHNLTNHDGCHAGVERLSIMLFAQMVDVPVAHSDEAATLAAAQFVIPKDRIHVIPHPGYCGYYPDTVTREEARQRFGFGDGERVFLFLGRIQPYKGVFDMIKAFSALPEHCRLLIAGNPGDEETERRLRDAATRDIRTVFYPGHVGREEVQWFFRAVDVVVFPFRKILTSGSVMLAMSFGKQLILPEGATMRETVGDGEALWFEPGNIVSLREKMRKAASQETCHGVRNAAIAEEITWEKMAGYLIRYYKNSAQ